MKPHLHIGDDTPWGPALEVRDLGNGCCMITTPDEGGLYVSQSVRKHLPAETSSIVLNQPGWPQHWADENYNMPITMAVIFSYLDKSTVISTFKHEEEYIHHSFWANLGLGVAKCFPNTYEPMIPLLEKIARRTSSRNVYNQSHHSK